MINKIKRNLLIIGAGITLLFAGAMPSISVEAACYNNIADNIAAGTGATGGSSNCSGSDLQSGSKSLISNITSLISYFVGAISVIMIIYAGLKYITSGGSNENTNSARNILLYAVIGLVVAVLAQLIVHLVLNSARKAV